MRGVRGNINMMGTQTFIQWMEQDFGIAPAAAQPDNRLCPGKSFKEFGRVVPNCARDVAQLNFVRVGV